MAANIKKNLKNFTIILQDIVRKNLEKRYLVDFRKTPIFSEKIPIAFLKTCYYNSKCTSIRGTFLPYIKCAMQQNVKDM